MRHAIYFAPRDSALLARLGARWLGRDALAGHGLQQPIVADIDGETFAAATAGARRYGFHGTLKAPIALKPECDETAFVAAATAFALTRAPVTIPAITLDRLGGFLALVPAAPVPALDALAGDLVVALDGFRAPASETEITRRRRAGLTPRQDALLIEYGYPYVLEEFRFHMTLTDALPAEIADAVQRGAARFFAPVLGRAVLVDALAHFVEPEPGANFVLRRFIPLGNTSTARH